ncbi:MAG: glycosyltransferase family 4 protein [Acetobacteraceae bacterium]
MAPVSAAPLSLPHRLWRLLPAERRRLAFARLTAALAPRPDRPAPAGGPGMILAGGFSRATGLGEGARLMTGALGRLGVDCWPLDISHDMWPGAAPDLASSAATQRAAAPPGAAVMLHVNPPLLPWVLLRRGRRLVRGRRVIGFWNWELETVPPLWHAAAPLVHEVWVSSHFTAGAIEKFMPGRVRVVPYPLAIAPPVPSARARASFGLPDEAVIVLVSFNLASSFARKNPLAAITAFRAACGERPDRLLVIKVGNAEVEAEDFATLQTAAAGSPNIRLFTDVLAGPDNHALTNAADIVLSLHRSEGFGLVPAEAMLLGKPVVATGWSGNLEFMDEESAALVPYRLVPARDPRGVYEYEGARWAEPDPAEAARRLAHLADDAAARATLGARAKQAAAEKLGAGPLEAALSAIGSRR